MLGIPLGLLYANAGEWFLHKHVLHGLGKNRNSIWNFHWHDHHRACRQNDHIDPGYQKTPLTWNAQAKETAALAALGAAHAPLLPVAPFFTATVWYSILNYYKVHKRAHVDPEWARHNLPWHYDHHMGRDQDQNWCVTRPWFDLIMGSRVFYVDTEHERKKQKRRSQSGVVTSLFGRKRRRYPQAKVNSEKRASA
jgi:sterol desaturase/sphingolipid hydroxylase (fatty acid hydroxylase superfamily)